MKIVVSDASWGNIDVERTYLSGDVELFYGDCKTEEAVIELCHDADGILCEYAPITPRVIDRLKNCKIISNSATGYDNIDADYAKSKGIAVANVKQYCTEEVATQVMTMILIHNRKIIEAASIGQKSGWPGVESLDIVRLSDQTLGLVGFGSIAQATAQRARAFGMTVLAHTSVPEDVLKDLGVKSASLEQVYTSSDIISVHKPLTQKTEDMISRSAFEAMKKRPYFINTSRGGLVDENALLDALDSGQICGAALDVLKAEPVTKDSPFLGRNDVLLTPHTGFYSKEALYDVRKLSALNVTNHLKGDFKAVSYV
jgi:D-3-phosphoglycerate dehydrogenase